MRPLPKTLYETLLTACRAVYSGNLVSLTVFGSWARETATPQSDVDLLVVANGLPDGRGRRCRRCDPSEVEAGSPLFLDMTDSIILLR